MSVECEVLLMKGKRRICRGRLIVMEETQSRTRQECRTSLWKEQLRQTRQSSRWSDVDKDLVMDLRQLLARR